MSSEPQGTHFFLIVIQYPNPNGGGYGIVHANGTWTPKRHQTRYDVFDDIRAQLERQRPGCRGGTIMAFDIQPNKI